MKSFYAWIFWFSTVMAWNAHAMYGGFEEVKVRTEQEARSRIEVLLGKYCPNLCSLISANAFLDEKLPDTLDLGFEGISQPADTRSFEVTRIDVEVQVDKGISQENRTRLNTALTHQLKSIAPAQIMFLEASEPRIGFSESDAASLKQSLSRELEERVQTAIKDYCPAQCLLSYILLDGEVVTEDEAKTLPSLEVYKAKGRDAYWRVKNVDIDVIMDTKMTDEEALNITSLLQASVRFVQPVNLKTTRQPFPESFQAKEKRLQAESTDPYGLDKLRHMLTLFRDLAGTKEIISNHSTEKVSSESKESSLLSSSESKESSSSSQSATQNSTTGGWLNNDNWHYWVIGIVVLVGLILIAALRMVSVNRDAHYMIHSAPSLRPTGVVGEEAMIRSGASAEDSSREKSKSKNKDLLRQVTIGDLKAELMDIFVNAPKIARDTFTKILQGHGIEECAKYLHLLGKVTVMELLDDPSLYRLLFDLSEYYERTTFALSQREELELLQRLKSMVTASEVKMLSQRTFDQFDFLSKLDPSQIFTLVREESATVQSIVLTQIPPLKRRAVFQTFEGVERSKLLTELSRSDAIPKEFLSHVANALARKVSSRAEFDTQNVRASDVLLDLMERSSLQEQGHLMKQLEQLQGDTARSIRTKLITIEMLPFLKTGHLLEIMMGLERQDLLTFLAGTKDHLRDLILSHAPAELSESWIEDLEGLMSIDEKRYLVVEGKILSRVRKLSADGLINILEINDVIFAKVTDKQQADAFSVRKEMIVA
jgi:flagellar motor switch protein FliG